MNRSDLYVPFSLSESAFESRLGVARGYTARGSECQTTRHCDAALAFTLDAMDFWRSENGVYGLVAIQD